jgi:ribosomal subunit interface protein
MDLSISFRNAEPSPAVVARVKRRAHDLEPLVHRQRPRLRVVCGHDAGLADTEVVARMDGRDFVSRATDEDMYEAIEHAFDRLEQQVARQHQRRLQRRGFKQLQ